MKDRAVLSAALLACATSLAACGGGGSATAPSLPASGSGGGLASGGRAVESVTVRVPSRSASAGKRAPSYVSVASHGIVITVTAPGVTVTPTPTLVGSLSDPTVCSPGGGGSVCTFSVSVPVGSDTFDVALYDLAPVNGVEPTSAHLLSHTRSTQTVSNNATNQLSFTLSGTAAALTFAQGTWSAPAAAGGSWTYTTTANAYDAAGAQILDTQTPLDVPVTLALQNAPTGLTIASPANGSLTTLGTPITIVWSTPTAAFPPALMLVASGVTATGLTIAGPTTSTNVAVGTIADPLGDVIIGDAYYQYAAVLGSTALTNTAGGYYYPSQTQALWTTTSSLRIDSAVTTPTSGDGVLVAAGGDGSISRALLVDLAIPPTTATAVELDIFPSASSAPYSYNGQSSGLLRIVTDLTKIYGLTEDASGDVFVLGQRAASTWVVEAYEALAPNASAIQSAYATAYTAGTTAASTAPVPSYSSTWTLPLTGTNYAGLGIDRSGTLSVLNLSPVPAEIDRYPHALGTTAPTQSGVIPISTTPTALGVGIDGTLAILENGTPQQVEIVAPSGAGPYVHAAVPSVFSASPATVIAVDRFDNILLGNASAGTLAVLTRPPLSVATWTPLSLWSGTINPGLSHAEITGIAAPWATITAPAVTNNPAPASFRRNPAADRSHR